MLQVRQRSRVQCVFDWAAGWFSRPPRVRAPSSPITCSSFCCFGSCHDDPGTFEGGERHMEHVTDGRVSLLAGGANGRPIHYNHWIVMQLINSAGDREITCQIWTRRASATQAKSGRNGEEKKTGAAVFDCFCWELISRDSADWVQPRIHRQWNPKVFSWINEHWSITAGAMDRAPSQDIGILLFLRTVVASLLIHFEKGWCFLIIWE